MLRRICFLLFLCVPTFLLAAQQDTNPSDSFPQQGFEDRIDFWKTVFTRYGQNDVIIHDRKDLRLVYKVVSLDRGESIKRQRAKLKAAERELEQRFDDLAALGPDSDKLEIKHHELLAVLKLANYAPTAGTLQRLKENIHLQRGIKEKFRDGLVRSGRYLPELERIFKAKGLPPELVMLPHVESSFDYLAYSHKGAAGIWQITRSTGKRFLKMGRSVDERLDPMTAAEAAADILLDNYRALGTWPLAITAYNQGKYGMMRAQMLHGSNLKEIVEKYESRIFGFAGENFYAEFLAALEIAASPERYFPSPSVDPPLSFESVSLPRRTTVGQLTSRYKVNETTLRVYNPHLTSHLWRRSRVVPAGTIVRFPLGRPPATLLAEASAAERETKAALARYKVHRGDTLGRIAKRFQVEVAELKLANGLRSTRIYLGQLLMIP